MVDYQITIAFQDFQREIYIYRVIQKFMYTILCSSESVINLPFLMLTANLPLIPNGAKVLSQVKFSLCEGGVTHAYTRQSMIQRV